MAPLHLTLSDLERSNSRSPRFSLVGDMYIVYTSVVIQMSHKVVWGLVGRASGLSCQQCVSCWKPVGVKHSWALASEDTSTHTLIYLYYYSPHTSTYNWNSNITNCNFAQTRINLVSADYHTWWVAVPSPAADPEAVTGQNPWNCDLLSGQPVWIAFQIPGILSPWPGIPGSPSGNTETERIQVITIITMITVS